MPQPRPIDECCTYEEANHWLRHDYSLGQLFWRFSTGPVKAGSRFGHMNDAGYQRGQLNGLPYLEHRLIYLLVHHKWPDELILHEGGKEGGNHIAGLSSGSNRENSLNQCIPINNMSGVMGVCWMKDRDLWRAQIRVHYQQINLGAFENFEDAVKARKEAEIEYGFHPLHGRLAANG